MIKALADAVEAPPFSMRDGAAYLRSWVTGAQTLAPALDVSFIASDPMVSSSPTTQSVAVVALEPSVADVRVENGGLAAQPRANPLGGMTPKMEVITGLSQAFRSQGMSWLDSVNKSYEMWTKLSVSLQQSLMPAAPNPVAQSAPAVDASNEAIPNEGDQPILPPEDNLDEPLEAEVE